MQLIEARLLWGEDAIGVAHVAPRELVRLADLGLPVPGDDQLIVSTLSDGRCVLVHEVVVRDGVALHLRLVDASTEKLPPDLGDLRVAQGVAIGAVLHATLLVLAFLVRMTATEEEAASFTAMKTWAAALEAREHPPADPAPGAGDAPVNDEPGTPTQPRAPGAAGSVESRKRSGVTQSARGEHSKDLHDPRRAEAARAYGMIGIINLVGGSSSGKNAFADYEGPSATGNLFGANIEDAIGLGGATLSGTGSGGGGLGEGIGINGVSGRCDAQCMRGPAGRAVGTGIGLGGGHATKAPTLRCGYEEPQRDRDARVGCNLQVNGRLPPEAVQRIVRQSFGRLRGCYESGLRRNPSLEGRIAVKFVIGRDGDVSMASAGEHDLADEQVVSCVVRGFQAMSFPQPAGGIVTVVYPVVFSS